MQLPICFCGKIPPMITSLFFIFAAKYLFILSFIVAGIYFLLQPRSIQKRIVIFSTISLVLIYLFATTAGHLYNNPRPFVVDNFTPLIPHAPDNGFPSDHVLLVSAIAAVFTYFGTRRIIISLWVIVALVAIGRVFVGVHHPIDVIASILISLLATYLTHIFFIYYGQCKT